MYTGKLQDIKRCWFHWGLVGKSFQTLWWNFYFFIASAAVEKTKVSVYTVRKNFPNLKDKKGFLQSLMFGWTFKIKAGNLNYFSSFKTLFKKREKISVDMVYVFLSIIHEIPVNQHLFTKCRWSRLHSYMLC